MKVELQHKTETFAEERKGLVGDRTETAKVLDELRYAIMFRPYVHATKICGLSLKHSQHSHNRLAVTELCRKW